MTYIYLPARILSHLTNLILKLNCTPTFDHKLKKNILEVRPEQFQKGTNNWMSKWLKLSWFTSVLIFSLDLNHVYGLGKGREKVLERVPYVHVVCWCKRKNFIIEHESMPTRNRCHIIAPFRGWSWKMEMKLNLHIKQKFR